MLKFAPAFHRLIGFLLLILLLAFSQTAQANRAQPTAVTDITIMNLSNTPTSSVDPFLIADRTGVAHLFWSEDVGGRVVMGGTAAGNTIMYARWDGVSWSPPIDILLTPLDPLGGFEDPKAWQPEAIIDDFGTIHLIWLGQYPDKLYYSRALAVEADRALAWTEPAVLADNSTGTQYAIDIEYVPATHTLHVIYARGHWEEQYSGEDPRAITHISSTDGGENWSEPVDVAFTPDPERGYSNVRLLFAPETRLFASWTEWDQTGNGQAVWVARSLDNGRFWDAPVKLAERAEGEYERDWTKLAWLGGDQLLATWEGGFRAYRHFMYSADAGQTWSEPHDTFYWLIGENGFVEFARDGADNLHFFIAQRIREGTIGRAGGEGLWHSTWQGERQWSDTQLVGGPNGMVNPRVVITNGNNLVATWYNSAVGEIIVLTGRLEGVPATAPQFWPEMETAVAPPETTTSSSSALVESAPDSTTHSPPRDLATNPVIASRSLGFAVWAGLMPVATLFGIILVVRYSETYRNWRKPKKQI
jgi:hypothetical protein